MDNVPLLSDQETSAGNGDTETQHISLNFAQPSTALEIEANEGKISALTELHVGIPRTALVPEPIHSSIALSLEPTSLLATPTALPRVTTFTATVDHNDTTPPTQPSVHGTWYLLPSEPHWEETVTMELDFSSYPQTAEIVQSDDDDIQAFSLQANLDQKGHEVIQHFTLTETGLVEVEQ